MTPQQQQTFLQARAVSRINTLSSAVTLSDDVSAITAQTGLQVPTQIAQVQQDQSTVQTGNTPNASVSTGPFGGRASH